MHFVNVLDRPMQALFFEQAKDGSLHQTETDQAVVDRHQEVLIAQRDAVLHIPTDEAGLPMDKIHQYAERVGLMPKHLLFLNPRHIARVSEISGSSMRDGGRYNDLLDLAIVRRNPEREAALGIEGLLHTASLGMHELAHANNQNTVYTFIHTPQSGWRRLGTLLTGPVLDSQGPLTGLSQQWEKGTPGHAAEEAYSDFTRLGFIRDGLQRPDGLIDPAIDINQTLFPRLYWHRAKSDTGEYLPSFDRRYAVGTRALDLVAQHNPQFAALLHANRTAESYDTIVRPALDDFIPGLGDDLYNLDTTKLDGGDIVGKEILRKLLVRTKG